MTRSLQSEILARLGEAPTARCLAFHRSQEPLLWLSRDDVFQRAVRASRLIRAHLDPGDVCVIVLPSDDTAAIAVLATLLAGGVPLLVAPPTLVGGNVEFDEVLQGTLRRTQARLVVCASSLQPNVAHLERRSPQARFVFVTGSWPSGDEGEPFVPVVPQTTAIAAMQLTSGTTARPRICVWDHQGVLAALDGMTAAMGLSRDDVCLNWTPLYHDMGLVNNFFLCLTRGVPLVLLSPQAFIRRPALWLRSLSETRATVTWSPNFGFAVTTRKADDAELEGVRLEHVRAFWNAAERIHLDTISAFSRRFAPLGLRPDAVKTNYGCAENVGGATFSALHEPPRCEYIVRQLLDECGIAQPVSAATEDAGTVAIVSTGRPNPGLTVRILSPRGRALPDGRVGEICLQTPSRMLRYHHDAGATRRALRGELLRTGDLGYLRDDELFWVGRRRERITVRGKKIDPSVFERVLESTPGLREGCFVAFGVATERLGTERVVVVSEVRTPLAHSPEDITAAIRRNCFLRLGLAPDDVILVPPGTLAKTSSGKRRHRYFRKLYLSRAFESLRLEREELQDTALGGR